MGELAQFWGFMEQNHEFCGPVKELSKVLGKECLALLHQCGFLDTEYRERIFDCKCKDRFTYSLRIEEVASGKYIGRCRSKNGCRPLELTDEDFELKRWSMQRFIPSLHPLLDIQGQPKEVERLKTTYRLGDISHPTQDGTLPVYYTQQDHKELYPLVLEILAWRGGKKKQVVLVPTLDLIDELFQKFMRHEGILLTPLDQMWTEHIYRTSLSLWIHEREEKIRSLHAWNERAKCFARIFSHEGSMEITETQYIALRKKAEDYDVFVDGIQKQGVKLVEGEATSFTLHDSHLQMLRAVAQKRGRFDPTQDTDFEDLVSAKQIFRGMRRLVDIQRMGKDGRKRWALFPTAMNQKMAYYTFDPRGFRYAFVFAHEEACS